MDVVALLISDFESSLLEDPCKDTFDDGAMLTQAAAMRGVSFREHGYYFSNSERFSNLSLGIVSRISIKFIWSSSPSAIGSLNGRNSINQSNGLLRIVDIGSGVNHRMRDAFTVADDMHFRTIFPAICGIRASFRPTKRARTELLSTTALEQSILFANPNSSRNFFQIFCQIPATCQSRSRRQHVMPFPHHSSSGKSSHAVTVRATNRIPVSARRSGTRGLPPFGRAFSGGKSGCIIFQSASVSGGFATFGPP